MNFNLKFTNLPSIDHLNFTKQLMSLVSRPRAIVNGTRRTRTFHYFWCLDCQRTVRVIIISNQSELLCPRCSNQLRHELDISRPTLQNNNFPAARLLDTLAQILDPINNSIGFERRSDHWVLENNDWITLQIVNNGPTSRPSTPPDLENQDHQDRDDIVFENALNETVGHNGHGIIMGQNGGSTGPPAAGDLAIEALPMVKVTETHLRKDPICPICKDEFEIGGEVREMPCNHFYHSDCIVPWLQLHKTCPVCRYELQESSTMSDGHGFHDNSFNWLWSQLIFFWPFRAFIDWWHHIFGFPPPRRRGKFIYLSFSST